MDDLEIARGDARELAVTLTLDGEDWPLPDGATLVCTGRRKRGDTDTVFVKTNADDGGIDVAGNIATVTIDPADTADLAAGGINTHVYCDVEVSGESFGPWTLTQFRLIVTPDVTRDTDTDGS